MSRSTVVYRCAACEAISPKWNGRCPVCGEWNSLNEVALRQPARPRPGATGGAAGANGKPVALAEVDPHAAEPRPTGIGELDRVLAGGLVAGSVTLLFGEPGIGKSTLLLQALAAWCRRGGTGLLVSAEESAPQVRARAARLGHLPESLLVSATADAAEAEEAISSARPDLVVVDSVQTVGDPELGGAAGTVTQVRSCVERMTQLSRRSSSALVLVGHVTKAGDPAGPRTLEHLVDTVLEFEGDRHHALRVLRAVKHRFGPTGEVGLFEMADTGLRDVPDPGSLLLGDRRAEVPGSIVAPVLQGRRALVVEVQALACAGVSDGMPRPSAQGVDPHRLASIMAVLRCRAGVDLLGSEIFVSTTGGISATEPAADLPIALAVSSAVIGVPVAGDMVAVGEIGLAGELRQVPHIGRRLAESARLGFARALVPSSTPEGPWPLAVERVGTVAEAIATAHRWSGVAARPSVDEGQIEGAPGRGAGTIPAWSSAAASL